MILTVYKSELYTMYKKLQLRLLELNTLLEYIYMLHCDCDLN